MNGIVSGGWLGASPTAPPPRGGCREQVRQAGSFSLTLRTDRGAGWYHSVGLTPGRAPQDAVLTPISKAHPGAAQGAPGSHPRRGAEFQKSGQLRHSGLWAPSPTCPRTNFPLGQDPTKAGRSGSASELSP